MASLYSTNAAASSDSHGSIRSEDGLLDLKLARPCVLCGRDDATNPDQLFAGGYAACFENARPRWSHCLEGCVEAGASAFFELGPGRALNEMAAGAYPEIPARSLDDFRTLQGARAWLSRASARSGDGEPVR